jgi:hypothetical protein
LGVAESDTRRKRTPLGLLVSVRRGGGEGERSDGDGEDAEEKGDERWLSTELLSSSSQRGRAVVVSCNGWLGEGRFTRDME